ncbi:superoxide dismutase [Aspergillus novofumigatus IBT 16806]|uniref:Superoxide dismutase n=1 Tax=Aspergillus novofumigatus (strain IBT 16806) TaxID=1392255 RepID=A0A2I1C8F8_ASPN1|nr:Mn superoxide dismutase MnSOD [Aspergillus novofumigatus IBT 16806]PKX93875.1 Mn superoxide dismutase MnSOD [Aspergillus novofumigatus IBT 16806]
MAHQYTLPPLPYAYEALEPYISQQIMELHHKKHHQTYVNGLNAALEAQKKAAETNDVPKLVSVQQAIKFNGGGHINHSLFWKNLAPEKSGGGKIDQAPVLKAAIEQRWGSFDKFKDAFNTTLLGIQGSGWGWLVTDGPKGKLDITTTHDQDPVTGAAPVFGVDMWEHAYYLQYLNDKASYAKGIWNVINWAEAENRYIAGDKGGHPFMKL